MNKGSTLTSDLRTAGCWVCDPETETDLTGVWFCGCLSERTQLFNTEAKKYSKYNSVTLLNDKSGGFHCNVGGTWTWTQHCIDWQGTSVLTLALRDGGHISTYYCFHVICVINIHFMSTYVLYSSQYHANTLRHKLSISVCYSKDLFYCIKQRGMRNDDGVKWVRIMSCIVLWCSLTLTSRAPSHWRHVPEEEVPARETVVTKWETVLKSGKD